MGGGGGGCCCGVAVRRGSELLANRGSIVMIFYEGGDVLSRDLTWTENANLIGRLAIRGWKCQQWILHPPRDLQAKDR